MVFLLRYRFPRLSTSTKTTRNRNALYVHLCHRSTHFEVEQSATRQHACGGVEVCSPLSCIGYETHNLGIGLMGARTRPATRPGAPAYAPSLVQQIDTAPPAPQRKRHVVERLVLSPPSGHNLIPLQPPAAMTPCASQSRARKVGCVELYR